MKKILIISHDASLSGATILLLNLMRLLKESGYRFNTIVRTRSGSLGKEFETLSDEFAFYPRRNIQSFKNKLKNRLLGKKEAFDPQLLLKDVDLILNNTITNGEVLGIFKENFNGPVISYIHEQEMTASFFTTKELACKTILLTNHFLVPSKAVKNYLQHHYDVPESKISHINSFIPSTEEIAGDSEKFRYENNLSASFIIGTLGSAGWIKGSDIFLNIASSIFKEQSGLDIQFVWMGVKNETIEYKRMLHDIYKLKLRNKVILVEQSPDVKSFFKNIHVLLLPSREDSYPLVVLEAASEKIPTLCFDSAGGAPEFVCRDAGTVVPYLDIEAMADAIIYYYNNRSVLKILGQKAFEKVKGLHRNKEIIKDQFNNAVIFLNIINSFNNAKGI